MGVFVSEEMMSAAMNGECACNSCTVCELGSLLKTSAGSLGVIKFNPVPNEDTEK